MVNNVYDVTSAGKADAPAIGAPRSYLAHLRRSQEASPTTRLLRLNGVGIGRGDRVAMVATERAGDGFFVHRRGVGHDDRRRSTRPIALKSSSSTSTISKPKAVIVQQGMDSPVRAVANKVGVPIVELVPTADAPAGTFTLDVSAKPASASAKPGTSVGGGDRPGAAYIRSTTARPKMVPLAGTATSPPRPAHIGGVAGLAPDDRRLNIMPLFHIHGLMAAVLSSLGAGAGVTARRASMRCASSHWLDDAKPTWYTAVPTMHQAILGRAAAQRRGRSRQPGCASSASSSASLPRAGRWANCEAAFGCPVIESYGMTEATHQMASNPLPRGRRKPGSGRPGGRAGGRRSWTRTAACSPHGAIGEVVIRGPNVTAGYEDNPEANAEAFADGWFRTGDQGALRRGRLSAPDRAPEGDHQPRRREGQPAGGRRRC